MASCAYLGLDNNPIHLVDRGPGPIQAGNADFTTTLMRTIIIGGQRLLHIVDVFDIQVICLPHFRYGEHKTGNENDAYIKQSFPFVCLHIYHI